MAYKVSYKVVSEQGEQLKNIAKDMDNYCTQISQIVSKLGNDELLQSVRGDLNKFKKQLEEEKTVLNLAGQILQDVVQSYSGTEKKNVQKVDKAKAHNRDFYKRPVSVPSAGGGAAAGATVNMTASATTASVNVTQTTTNVFVNGPGGAVSPGNMGATPVSVSASDLMGAVAGGAESVSSGGGAAAAATAAAILGAGAGVAGTVALKDAKDKDREDSED